MRTVVQVARAEAITTAAQTLGLTQSAVSRSVAELEDALGKRLFDRLPRGIQLTDAGKRFVARSKRVLADVDDLVADVREAPDRVTGRLRLGIASSGGYATSALLAFAQQHPEVAIETVTGSAQVLCPKLLHGKLDMVVGSSGYLKRWRELEVTALRRMHFGCMVRKDHPLSKLVRPSEVDVLSYPLILPESVEVTYSDIAQRYAHHAIPRLQPHYVTEDFDLVKRLVLSTDAFFRSCTRAVRSAAWSASS
jgi:DNA-binding transcriptional LysR family regulator